MDLAADIDWTALRRAAESARSRAYVRYSGFPVGCAILLADGSIVVGVNVENASYGLTLCAERSALSQIVSTRDIGHREIVAIAVAAPEGVTDCSPCGACRQWIVEHAPRALVGFPTGGEWTTHSAHELLPLSFSLDDSEGPADA